MGKLRVISEGLQNHEFNVPHDGIVRVGRADDCDWCIPHPSISSHHCTLVFSQGALRVQDNGSTNGTQLDGQPVSDAEVSPGQTLKF